MLYALFETSFTLRTNITKFQDFYRWTPKAIKMLRFVLKLSSWKPTQSQIIRAGNAIQVEEEKRVSDFHFQNDAKSALVGRLLLRFAICKMTNLQWDKICLSRTSKGKPILNTSLMDDVKNLSFNISHQGDIVLAVISSTYELGVDVMNSQETHGDTKEFFKLMNRNFTETEWKAINSPIDNNDKMLMFYRHWCLKESFVKATGDGIGYSLQRISFSVNSTNDEFRENLTSQNISLKIDDKLVGDWIFQEDLIDANHCSATALKHTGSKPEEIKFPCFTDVNIDTILEYAKPLRDCDNSWFWDKFNTMPAKPIRK